MYCTEVSIISGLSVLMEEDNILYTEFVKNDFEIIFQQDNAPAHKKASVKAFLDAQSYETLAWPPQSPDLSPIEWVWNIIKMKMKTLRPRPRTPASM